MRLLIRRSASAPAVAVLLLGGVLPGAAAAAGADLWERADAYVVVGVADARARPATGGTITMSFNDADTAALDKSITSRAGRNTKDLFTMIQAGLRDEAIEHLTMGIELQFYSFSDAMSGVPLDTPGTTPLTNFATFRESSRFELEARDVGLTVGYRRWNANAELLVGARKGSFDARADVAAFGVFTTGNFVNLNMANGSSFEGDGGVFGLRLAYELPRFPLTLVARYHYAKLDGDTSSFGSVAGTVAASPNPPLVGAATVTRNNLGDSSATIHDQEYGLQYGFTHARSGARSFVRLSWVKSDWELGGPPTGGAGFGGTISDLTTNSFASAGLGEGKVSGFALSAGVSF